MDNTQDVFKIFEGLQKRVLGISDDPKLKKFTQTGFNVAFMPVGISINPDDYSNPWSPALSEDDVNTTAKRQESLVNLCRLVDSKISLDGSGLAIPGSTSISKTWQNIVDAANAMPAAMETDPAIKKATEEATKKLFLLDAEGQIIDDSPAYKKYKECFNKYNDAVEKLSDEYLNAASDKIKLNQWPIKGKRYKDEAYRMWDEWNAIGQKNTIEQALSFISAQGVDISAKVISAAKKNMEDNKVLLLNNYFYYTRVRPSNWYDPDSSAGWKEYTYIRSKNTSSTDTSNSKWSGSAGFWKIKANASGSKEKSDIKSESEELEIIFKYAQVNIDRLYMDHAFMMSNLDNWFLKGAKKGSISNGTSSQNVPSNEPSWLPAIPTAMIVVKDVHIKSNDIKKNESDIKSTLEAGGSIGWGGFSASGSYEKSNASKRTGVEITNEGLILHGVFVTGWISELFDVTAKRDDPATN